MNYKLVTALMKKAGFNGSEAYCRAWRIENEYPPQLKTAAEQWLRDETPEMEVEGYRLSTLLSCTGGNVPKALELMYVLSKDVSEGLNIVAYCSPRDNLK